MGVASRRCRAPHPTATWAGPGGVIEPHRCVEQAGHPLPHRAVLGVSGENPGGIPLVWR